MVYTDFMNGFYASSIALFVLAAVLPCTAGATEVYRWVDEAGVVHFSQVAPASEGVSAEKLTIEDDRPSDYDPERDLYGVAEQAERMQALREERRAKREAALERQRQQPQPVIVRQEPEYGFFPVYGRPWLRPPWPRPPIARPPGNRPPGAGDWIKPPGPITPPAPLDPPPVEP